MAQHVVQGRKVLDQAWQAVLAAEADSGENPALADLVDLIFEGKEVGWKKAIIIQLTGKAADPDVDAQSMQKGDGTAGAWDAREFAKKVFVPWNAEIGWPLGDADDPYVSNQFRNPRLDNSIRAKRRALAQFDATISILESAQSAEEAQNLLVEVLLGLRRLMRNKRFNYAVPQRASLTDTMAIVSFYLSEASGGTRLQAIVHALFKCLADAGMPYSDIFARHVNASDSASQAPGDVAFVAAGKLAAVEVKDRLLTYSQLEVSVKKARVAEVTELIFVIQAAKDGRLFASEMDKEAGDTMAAKEFASGLNIYWTSYVDLARQVFALVGESGRKRFLQFVGEALEEQSVDARHRWAWAQAVGEM